MTKLKKIKGKPFITIITVVKNDEKKISKTLKSVFNQSFKDFEYIVIDGKSKDNTLKIIQKYKSKIDHIISKKDKNMWHAINAGIKLSSGSIIGILNSGDIFYKETLVKVNDCFKKQDIDYLFGPVKKDRVWFKFNPELVNYRLNIYPSHSISFFISKNIQKKIGLYDANLKYGADYDLFYKLFKNKNYKGIVTKRNYVFGKFDMNGLSSKIPFYLTYFYEMKVRYKNGQNVIFLFFLYCVKILNKFINYLKFKIKLF